MRKRDEIINQLQKRIQELEILGLSDNNMQAEDLEERTPHDESYNTPNQTQSKPSSSGSEDMSGGEEGFMVSW